MSFKIPQLIRIKMRRAYNMASKHADLTAEIDQWFSENGIDVNIMRELDAASYVDCIDYGQAEVDDVEKGINEEWELIKKEQGKRKKSQLK